MDKKKCPMTGKEVSMDTCICDCCIVDCSTLLSESNLVLEKVAKPKADKTKDL